MTELADYYEALACAHEIVHPDVYLEIGVHEGHSFRLATAAKLAVGVDPAMNLQFESPPGASLFRATSDEFFALDADDLFASAPVDLAFVDGLHHWDQTLRDFAHTERHSHPDGRILIHDCLPIDAATSARERTTVVWSGDVWKVVLWLRRHRPDLCVTTLDVGPTGLAVVTGLDPDHGAELGARDFDTDIWELDYDAVRDSIAELVNVVPGTRAELEGALAV